MLEICNREELIVLTRILVTLTGGFRDFPHIFRVAQEIISFQRPLCSVLIIPQCL